MHSTVDARAKLHAVLAGADASLEDRVAAGDELARLGDERATAIDRVPIPAGPFLCGGHEGEGGVKVAPRTVQLSAFRIDRYPVTVGAYAELVAAGGYRERRLWSRAGWAWRTRERVDKPRFWDE